jgi:hypothetical protein
MPRPTRDRRFRSLLQWLGSRFRVLAKSDGAIILFQVQATRVSNAAVVDGMTHERIVCEQQVPVEVDVIGQWREVSCCSDPER